MSLLNAITRNCVVIKCLLVATNSFACDVIHLPPGTTSTAIRFLRLNSWGPNADTATYGGQSGSASRNDLAIEGTDRAAADARVLKLSAGADQFSPTFP